MEEILASVDDITFEIERQIENQVGLLPLPFPLMDKSGAAVCEFHLKGNCEKDDSCPLRHSVGDQTVVCKHWLRGLCKKGDKCEFLHVYDMSRMPECYFFSKFNACTNKECTFLHIDPSTKKKDCPWYDRGFCRHGPSCRHKHTKRVLCMNYVAGFCPKGPECRHVHPKHNVNPAEQHQNHSQQQQQQHLQTNSNNHHQAQNHHEIQHQIPTLTQHSAQSRQMQQNHQQPLQQIPVHQNMHHHHHHHHQPHQPHQPHQQHMFHNQNNLHSVPHNYTPFQDNGQFNVKPHPQQQSQQAFSEQPQSIGYPNTMINRRSLNQVQCFKCGVFGHYANRCTVKKNMAYP